MTTWIYTRTNELRHHGIKGQRWGIRRFQNKDGSLTPAGRRRYDDGNGIEKVKNYEKVEVGGQTFKIYGKRKENKDYAQQVRERAKNLNSKTPKSETSKKTDNVSGYNIPKNKSLHRLKLEDKYRQQGLSQEQAEQKAAKRIKAEKYVAAAATITAASCIAYAKYKGYTSDKTIKANTDFQRIMRLSENAEIRQDSRQYLALNKSDKVKYKGLLGDSLNKQAEAQYRIDKIFDEENAIKDRIYNVTVKNKGDINIASRKRSVDTFSKLYENDPEFRKGLEAQAKKMIDSNPFGVGLAQGKLDDIAIKLRSGEKLNKLELRSKGYDLFNVLLVDKDENGTKNANKFYEALRLQGMNAIIDVNDKKYSGYKAKMPIITFDGDFDHTRRMMSDDDIQQNLKKGTRALMAPELLKQGAIFVGMASVRPVINKAAMDKKVLQYKQDHPNTEMTDAEIKAMFQEELQKGGGKSK